MAVSIISNRKNTSAVIHVSSANASLVVAGNNSVSNIAMGDEIITGAYIAQVAWGCDGNGHIQISRGGELVAVFDSAGYTDYAGNGIALTVGQTANIDVSFVGSANGYCLFEVQKVGTFVSEYFQT